ncbi:unnamed protein product [Orchesella dallaii]|uniref:Endocuticle structural glycoprotein SgAbd-2 n=1 Tax=Orchesella dallaii TaxID=48710 RepID=A0ABP1QQN4_9HEXA
MKLLVVFAVCVTAANAVPGGYGSSSYSSPLIINRRLVSPSPPKSYEKPIEVKAEIPSYAEYPEALKKLIPILKLRLENDNKGTYDLESISGDGSKITEQGSLKDLGDKEGPVTVSRGSYSFVGDDGKTYKVDWTADENGFQAKGDHLPTPPPIPAEILKSLEENKVQVSSYDDSSYSSPNIFRVSSHSYSPTIVKKIKTVSQPVSIRIKSGAY